MPHLFNESLLDPSIFLKEAGGQSPVSGWPAFGNHSSKNSQTGVWKTNVGRLDPTEELVVNLALLTNAKRSYLLNFWRVMRGSGIGFRVRVPYDFTVVDEVFGQGDGATTVFYLKNTYTVADATTGQDVRRIGKPVIDTLARLDDLGGAGGSVRLYEPGGVTPRVIPSPAAVALGVPGFTVKVGGSATTAYVISNTTGKITFTSAPANGVPLSWSGEFDAPMAFVGNTLQHQHDVTSTIQSARLREILLPELGIYV